MLSRSPSLPNLTREEFETLVTAATRPAKLGRPISDRSVAMARGVLIDGLTFTQAALAQEGHCCGHIIARQQLEGANMSWLLEVKDAQTLGFGIEENSAPRIYGDAVSELFNGGHHHPLLPRVRDAQVAWMITVPEASNVKIDGNNVGLLKVVRDGPTKVHGMALFYKGTQDDPKDMVAVHVVVPWERFVQIRHLFELSLLSRLPMANIIEFPFYGFREPAATTTTPTWQEFIDGKPLMFDEMSITGRRLVD